MSTVLEIKGLSKKYKDVQALDKVSISVEAGQVFGILGPNGSGKTTTLGILLGVINPTEGTYSWFENGTKDINRTRIGALLETPNFYPYLSAVRNLRIVAQIKNLSNPDDRINEVLKIVNLDERKNSEFKTYSLGMRQRLAIASTILTDPEVLVFDEPTNGLDPQGIAEIRELIIEISKRGKTIVLASHALDEVEKVCTHVAILKKGVLIRQSDIENIIGDARQIVVSASGIEDLESKLTTVAGVRITKIENKNIILDVEDSVTTEDLNKQMFDAGIVLTHLEETHLSLEAQFLEITKEETEEGEESSSAKTSEGESV